MMQLGHTYEEQPGKSRIEETWPVHVPLPFCKINCQMSHRICMNIFCKALMLVTVDGSDQTQMPAMTISMSEPVRGGEGAPRERSSSNGFTLRVREVWLPKHRHATWSFGAFRSHYTSTVQWVSHLVHPIVDISSAYWILSWYIITGTSAEPPCKCKILFPLTQIIL